MTTENNEPQSTPEPQGTPGTPGPQEPVDWKAKYEAESALRSKYEKFAKDDKDAAAAWRAHQESTKEAPVALTDTERELAQYKAAAKHGIPAEYLSLIDGSDADAIEAKAAALVPLITGKSTDDKSGDPEPKPEGDPAPAPQRFADPAQQGDPAPDEAQVKEAFARQLFGV